MNCLNKIQTPSEILETTIFLFEGKDDEIFFEYFIKWLVKNDSSIVFPKLHYISLSSKTKLETTLKELKINPTFKNIKRLLIITDADDDYNKSYATVSQLLKKYILPIPGINERFATDDQITVGIYFFPDNKTPGMLESLCIQSVSEEPIYKDCVQKFFDCIANHNPKRRRAPRTPGIRYYPHCEDKAKLQAFVSGRQLLDSIIGCEVYLAAQDQTKSMVGHGAQEGYWNFDHPCFDSLKEFVLNLRD